MQLIVGLAPVSSSQIYKQMWQKTPYMRERLAQLEPLMNELDPHEPVNCTVSVRPSALFRCVILYSTSHLCIWFCRGYPWFHSLFCLSYPCSLIILISYTLQEKHRACAVDNVFSRSVATQLRSGGKLCTLLDAVVFRVLCVENYE